MWYYFWVLIIIYNDYLNYYYTLGYHWRLIRSISDTNVLHSLGKVVTFYLVLILKYNEIIFSLTKMMVNINW